MPPNFSPGMAHPLDCSTDQSRDQAPFPASTGTTVSATAPPGTHCQALNSLCADAAHWSGWKSRVLMAFSSQGCCLGIKLPAAAPLPLPLAHDPGSWPGLGTDLSHIHNTVIFPLRNLTPRNNSDLENSVIMPGRLFPSG